MSLDNNQEALFELVRAGLWEKEARLSKFNNIDYAAIMQLAEEQSVLGLVTAGLEQVKDVKVTQEWLLQFIGQTLQIEQQNKDLNVFLARLIELLRQQDVYAVLVKGQGIAQCYEKPLWRASGDVDLLLSDSNYEKAKKVLISLSEDVEKEYKTFKHLGMTMKGGYVVELHGTMHSRLSRRIDRVIDEAQKDVFYGGNVRSWMNSGTSVFLPSPDNDVIFVFTHILHHYYIEGIGLRQICDWCRLLYTYKDSLNLGLLESRIRKAGLMTEWKAFGEFAVEYLGMPAEAMPLFNENDNHNDKLKRKAERIMKFVLECGNFGHKREAASGKMGSAWLKFRDFARHSLVFPVDSLKFFCHFMVDGIKLAMAK
jgi:hypothetical protein